MYVSKTTTILILLIIPFGLCANCNHSIQIRAYREIDSESVIVTNPRIQYDDDLFRLQVIDQVIPELCTEFIQIHNELSVLELRNNSINTIRPGAFAVTPVLTLLQIRFNPLHTIGPNAFLKLKVKEIDLSDNQLTAIDQNAFANNSYLQIVKLSNNQLKIFEPEWFINTKIYNLDINTNDITRIPAKAFRHFDKERPLKLCFSINRITELDPNAFEGIRSVDVLRLNGNQLPDLPEHIFKNCQFKVLQVNANRLKCLPDVVFGIRLKRLFFIDNTLFECVCLRKVRKYVEENGIDVNYPSIICEDRVKEVNIVFSFNRTYELPLPVDMDAYVPDNS